MGHGYSEKTTVAIKLWAKKHEARQSSEPGIVLLTRREGDMLRHLLIVAKRMTTEEIARRIGCSKPTVSRLFCGVRHVRRSTFLDALGLAGVSEPDFRELAEKIEVIEPVRATRGRPRKIEHLLAQVGNN